MFYWFDWCTTSSKEANFHNNLETEASHIRLFLKIHPKCHLDLLEDQRRFYSHLNITVEKVEVESSWSRKVSPLMKEN